MKRRQWTRAEDLTMQRLYPTTAARDISERLGRGVRSIYCRAGELGLAKSKTFAADITRQRWADGRHENSRKTHFKAGQAPANKGQRRPGYAPGRMAQTQFKHGQMSGAAHRNYVPIGTERINREGLLERKVTDDPSVQPVRRWVPVSRLVWEATHGPIPKGHVVRFKPGMHAVTATEITADKLECISKAENMRRNSYHNYPQPIPKLIQLRGALNRKINKREASLHEEQN